MHGAELAAIRTASRRIAEIRILQTIRVAEERADSISPYILQERNVTLYNAGTGWASRIYPICANETFKARKRGDKTDMQPAREATCASCIA